MIKTRSTPKMNTRTKPQPELWNKDQGRWGGEQFQSGMQGIPPTSATAKYGFRPEYTSQGKGLTKEEEDTAVPVEAVEEVLTASRNQLPGLFPPPPLYPPSNTGYNQQMQAWVPQGPGQWGQFPTAMHATQRAEGNMQEAVAAFSMMANEIKSGNAEMVNQIGKTQLEMVNQMGRNLDAGLEKVTSALLNPSPRGLMAIGNIPNQSGQMNSMNSLPSISNFAWGTR